eukprot:1193595-Prorocentrum_minimum.AAC.4
MLMLVGRFSRMTPCGRCHVTSTHVHSEDTMRAMIDMQAVEDFRARAMNPMHPHQRGTSQVYPTPLHYSVPYCLPLQVRSRVETRHRYSPHASFSDFSATPEEDICGHGSEAPPWRCTFARS